MQWKSLDHISEQALLETRICDLGLCLKKSSLMRGINQLYYELNLKLINFIPHIWLADDWFSPDGVAGFALPFYLAHPRLILLEKKFVGRVEGETPNAFIKLLRHETAHALDNAFHLRCNKRRQSLFGLTSQPYPKSYLPNAKSKDYVRHLEDFYAQSHPDEDWAETFAVWLNPHSEWKSKYANWPALKKLEFLDEVFTKFKNKKQLCFKKDEISSIHTDKRTLKQYYKEKRKSLRLNRIKPVYPQLAQINLNYVLTNKAEVKKLLQKNGLNNFIASKFLKDLAHECKNQNFKLKYRSRMNNVALEKELQMATKHYIEQGRHRIVM